MVFYIYLKKALLTVAKQKHESVFNCEEVLFLYIL